MYFDNFFKSVLFFLTATKHASSQNLSPWNITKNLTYMGNINKYTHKQKTLKTVIFFSCSMGYSDASFNVNKDCIFKNQHQWNVHSICCVKAFVIHITCNNYQINRQVCINITTPCRRFTNQTRPHQVYSDTQTIN